MWFLETRGPQARSLRPQQTVLLPQLGTAITQISGKGLGSLPTITSCLHAFKRCPITLGSAHSPLFHPHRLHLPPYSVIPLRLEDASPARMHRGKERVP